MGEVNNRPSSGLGRRSPNLELVDLHIYVVPSDSWIENRKLAQKDVIDQSVSSGFVRILPSTSLSQLRKDIQEQLGGENFPDVFVFLRSVGRNFTQVKTRQEEELKVKNFLPPYADEPELYIKLGDYVTLRSASLGSEAPLVRKQTPRGLSGKRKPNTAEASTQSFSIPDSLELSSQEEEKRSRSWDASRENLVNKNIRYQSFGPRSMVHKVSPRRIRKHISGNSGRARPPTPRINEWSLGTAKKKRPSTVAPKGISQVRILEIPNESVDDSLTDSHSLEIQPGELDLNSPPPKQPSRLNGEGNGELHLTVPMLPDDSQRLSDESQFKDSKSEAFKKKYAPESEGTDHEEKELSTTNTDNRKHVKTETNNGNEVLAYERLKDVAKQNGSSKITEDSSADDNKSSSFSDSPASTQDSKLTLDLLKSEINGDTAIVDPIKLLQSAGETYKNFKVDSRDHFDEGFHSGELVASDEENSNETEETVRETAASSKPDRAGTPMPRNTYYRVVKPPREIEELLRLKAKLHSEVRMRELKKDALNQKIRDLQKRNTTTSDQARDQWRKRFIDVKKHTPRLEDHCTMLRRELERLVREMLVNVPNADNESKSHGPSKKTSYEIMIMRLLQEVEDLRRRLQSVTIRLNAEIKLRSHAENEVKKLRKDLLQKKTQVTLTRKQATFPRPQSFFISAV